HEKEKIALAQRFFCGTAHLCAQFPFADTNDPAGVPHCERPGGAFANRGNSIACDSGLIMNDGNLSADKAIEQRRLAYVWPPDNCDIRLSGRHLGFRRIRMACSLQLPNAVCHIDDSGDCSEEAGCDYDVE